MKIAVIVLVVGEVVLLIAKAVSGIIRFIKKDKAPSEPIRRDWYGNCENCGTLGGLHRFQGKRYCAVCYARIKTEWDFAKKAQKDHSGKETQ